MNIVWDLIVSVGEWAPTEISVQQVNTGITGKT